MLCSYLTLVVKMLPNGDILLIVCGVLTSYGLIVRRATNLRLKSVLIIHKLAVFDFLFHFYGPGKSDIEWLLNLVNAPGVEFGLVEVFFF